MQNQQLSDVKGKELVAAGHALANAIGMDTPLIEIAKMMAELATRLDCALVRGDELEKQRDMYRNAEVSWEKAMMEAIGEDGVGSVSRAIAELKAQRDALAAENAALARYFSASAGAVEHWNSWADADDKLASAPETAATDAYLNSVRAEGVEMFARFWEINCGHEKTFIGSEAKAFAAQLRSGEPS
ncbi:hypothetical protein ACR3LR_08440 [Pantoea eucalypti]|uniref:hypothetical protein n=1 Tax=Pantoea eucalypti TaxID=470933 RepID=UPI003EE60687